MKGLLIGNGWIDPTTQYISYATYAYAEHVIESGTNEANRVENQLVKCKVKLNERRRISEPDCEELLNQILSASRATHGGKCVNMYDIRLVDDYPSCGMSWPSELQYVTPYLRKSEVTAALHLNSDKRTGWTECAGGVSSTFKADMSDPAIDLFPSILAQIPILLFTGQRDLICNHLGIEEMIHRLTWNNATGFEESPGTWAPRQTWLYQGEEAGYYQASRNLTHVLFYNSSHMVPYDVGARSLDMLNRFMNVDVSTIGSPDQSSTIGGTKAGPSTSVEDISKAAQEEEQAAAVTAAKWRGYYEAGGVVLVIVAIGACVLGWYVYRQRQASGSVSFREVFFNVKSKKPSRASWLEEGRATNNASDEGDPTELDELVVDTPIFESDYSRDDEEADKPMSPSSGRLRRFEETIGITDED